VKYAGWVVCARLSWCATRGRKKPADTETKELGKYCYEHGLITISAGTYGNVMRILVPLVVTDEQFEEGMDVLESGLAAAVEKKQLAQATV